MSDISALDDQHLDELDIYCYYLLFDYFDPGRTERPQHQDVSLRPMVAEDLICRYDLLKVTLSRISYAL